MMPTAKKRDVQVISDITDIVSDYSPFDSTRKSDELLSFTSGLSDRTGLTNTEQALEFGESFLTEMDDLPYTTTIKRSKRVNNLASLKPSVKVGCLNVGQEDINPLHLFTRLSLIGSRVITIEQCLEHELSPYPLSLFDENGLMRPRNKSQFGTILKSLLDSNTASEPPQPGLGSIVIDGGCLLWQVEWRVGATFGEFAQNVAKRVRSLSGLRSTLVFDGYLPSAKDLEHVARMKFWCTEQAVDEDKKILVTKNKFFSSSENKENLVKFLTSWLPTCDTLADLKDFMIEKGDRDADTLVVKKAREQCENSDDPVVVHGTDTDLLILLLHHCHTYQNLWFGTINIKELWDKISADERSVLLVAYCFSGVDTVSSFFGKGPASILKLFSTNREIRDIIAPSFLDPSASGPSLEMIDMMGIRLVRLIYGKSADMSLSKLRFDSYNKQCLAGKVAPERLAPTKGAAIQHCRRAYQQCREWVMLDTDIGCSLLGWRWDSIRALYLPIYSELPAAPAELDKFVSCKCKSIRDGGCCSSGNCSCVKNGVRCIPSICATCIPGGSCQNLNSIEVEEEEDENGEI